MSIARRLLVPSLLLTLAACGAEPADPADPLAGIDFTDVQPVVVEAACGQCQFGLEGTGCDLALRAGDEAHYVDGTGIDDHGDSHANDGFCNAIREAEVVGVLVDGRYKVRSMRLLPADG